MLQAAFERKKAELEAELADLTEGQKACEAKIDGLKHVTEGAQAEMDGHRRELLYYYTTILLLDYCTTILLHYYTTPLLFYYTISLQYSS